MLMIRTAVKAVDDKFNKPYPLSDLSFVPVHALKEYGGVMVLLHVFLNSELDEGELSASYVLRRESRGVC
jgi:hypothetical protein